MDDFEWTEPRELAAQLLADGRLSDWEIAEKCGICRATLYNWRQAPAFAQRVAEHLAVFRDEVHRRGLASRDRRVRRQNDHWNRLQTVIENRAEEYARALDKHRADPKGNPPIHPAALTGLLVWTEDGWEVDTALLKELRALEQHAAKELGQWSEKHEFDFSNLSDEEIIARAASALGRSGAAGSEPA